MRLRRRGQGFVHSGESSCTLGHPFTGRSPNQPEGIFAQWSWNGQDLVVRNDRYGFYPLYYYIDGHEVALSPSIPRLVDLRGGVELDPAAMAVFLRLGFFVGDDTPFKGIRAMPPNAVARWGQNGFTIVGSRPRTTPTRLSRNAARDAFIELFRNAIGRRLPVNGSAILPLSGGKDSRHILLELYRAGVRPDCVTLRLPTNEDASVARALTRTLELRHVVLPPPASRILAERRKNVLTSFCADEHGWYMPVADYLRHQKGTIYDGIGGDVLSCSANLTSERIALFREGRLEELARGLWLKSTEARLSKLLPAGQYGRFNAELALNRLVEELRDHANLSNPIGSFFFHNRTRREVALMPFALVRDVAGPVHAPFLDHDIYDLLAGLSSESLLDRRLHVETIQQAFPNLSHLPFGGRVPKVDSRVERFRYGRELLQFTMNGSLPRFIRLPHLVPRALRYIVDARYEWNGNLAVYLIQLERMQQNPSTSAPR